MLRTLLHIGTRTIPNGADRQTGSLPRPELKCFDHKEGKFKTELDSTDRAFIGPQFYRVLLIKFRLIVFMASIPFFPLELTQLRNGRINGKNTVIVRT